MEIAVFRRIHNLLPLLVGLALIALLTAPTVAQAIEDDLPIEEWSALESERNQLLEKLESLEREHQEFVVTLENLKDRHSRGEISRRQLEDRLREHLRMVEELEEIQRELRSVDEDRDQLRSQILDQLEGHQRLLEHEARQASPRRRAEIVQELNSVQRMRRQFVAPVPEADEQRVSQVLAMARELADSHPRAMLSAVDELEDTQDQVLARLEAVEARIDRLEQLRALQRQSRQFAELDEFFDESDRGRQVTQFEQAVTTGDGGEDTSDTAGGDSDEEVTATPEMDDGMDHDPHSGASDSGDLEDSPPEGGQDFAGDPDSMDDPFGEERQETETIVIETDISADEDSSFLSDREMERDLRQLHRERRKLEEQADELRRQADELRDRADEQR